MSRKRRFEILEDIRTRLNADTTEGLDIARADLDHVAPTFRAAMQRLMDARRGLPGAQSFDSPSVSGGSSSSPTERLASQVDGAGRDVERLDAAMRMLLRHVDAPRGHEREIRQAAHTVRRIGDAWTPHAPSEKQREIVEAANAEPEKLCQHCTPHRAKGHAERVHRTGDAAGNLDAPIALCHWCYRFVLRTGRLPVKSEIQRNDNGQRVMVKA